MPERAAGLALAAVLLAAVAPAAGDNLSPILQPELAHYSLQCHGSRGCRIDCYQNGVNVVSRLNIGADDDIRLVVSAGLADVVRPRWIEIRPADGEDIQTVLLTDDTLCDLQSLTIKPLEGG